ncbi:MAG TPA: glycoside hydrolase family 3 N-terminal domain-containing protein [Pyrinomonadaceae bacterium]|nr:glycoside hydrolase family 3 N-terminal domain-containing protein [Pyrinomonadaceae bacterium]
MTVSLHNLPIEQKIGQLFFIGIGGTVVDADAESLFNKINPGGICLFARNIREARQTRDLLDTIRQKNSVTPFLSLDQEGGLVDRLRKVITPMPAANLFRDADAAGRFGATVAKIVRILGFNMDFAPVVDVINQERETVTNGLFSRAFGTSAEEAAQLAGAFLENLQNGGCLGCVKHFPGLGASAADSHEELPQVSITEQELRDTDLVPYQRLIERDLIHCVMVAHASFPNIGLQESALNGKLLPSSLSGSFITGLLRSELGFDRLVITDDLEMGAIIKNFGIGEACVMAVEAGSDMLAICADAGRINEGYDAVSEAIRNGRITEDRIDQSLERIADAKSLLQEPLSFDTQRLAELSDSVARLNDELK